jgi:hypothetical protein
LGSEHSRKSHDGKERQIERGLDLKKSVWVDRGMEFMETEAQKRKVLWKIKKRKKIF